MGERYNIYYGGEILPGHDSIQVREQLARLFKADQTTLERLFSGKLQLIKKDCDEATARKFHEAMQRCGAKAQIRAAGPAGDMPAVNKPEPANTAPVDTAPTNAAQRIAALAAAPDELRYRSDVAEEPEEEPDDPTGLRLLPLGAVMTPPEDDSAPKEDSVPEPRPVQTPALSLSEQEGWLSTPPPAAPPAPDTGHLSMGAVGDAIPSLPPTAIPLDPDTDGIDLCPSGTDFNDCLAERAAPPTMDLSAMSVAPANSDLLEAHYRPPAPPPAPATGHISLKD